MSEVRNCAIKGAMVAVAVFKKRFHFTFARLGFLGILITLLTSSCAGYQFRSHKNPLERYGIESLAVPMFINKSILPNVVGPFTSELKLLFDSYPGLDVYAGENPNADAVLIGIVMSDDFRRAVLKRKAEKFTSGELKDSIGSRAEFYLPSRTKVELGLRLVLVKDPRPKDRALIQRKEFAGMTGQNPRVIFDESFSLSHQFSRIIEGTTTLDSGGVVNYVKNHQAVEIGIQSMADNVRRSIEDEVLNVF